MFSTLIKSALGSVRATDYTFYEIGSQDWIDHVITDEVAPEKLSNTERTQLNRRFGVAAVACSLAPGVDKSIPELIEEIRVLPDVVIDELFAHVDELNHILPKVVAPAGKDSRADASPES